MKYALELFAYERMTHAKLVKSGLAESSIPPLVTPISPLVEPTVFDKSQVENSIETFSSRIMLIVLSSLAKLAARCQDLTSRVVLCMLKVLTYQQYFGHLVIARANELITLLKFPSIASAVLDIPFSTKEIDEFHLHDKNSSLPFLLLPTSDSDSASGENLHPFTLY